MDPETSNPLKLMTNTGTCKYKAPEILGGFMSYYDQRVDLWSCGAVLYYLTCEGNHAFPMTDTKDIENAIQIGKYEINIEPYQRLSAECKDFIS